ncbi:MAG: site-specific integrase, partial [Gammaproteobacteria bacterium]
MAATPAGETGNAFPRPSLEWVALFTHRAQEERRLTASTLEAYTLDLTMVSRWASGQRLNLLKLSTSDLTRYVVERAADGTHRSTLARHVSSFRSFYAFLVRQGAIVVNPAATVPVPQALRRSSSVVRDEVLRALLWPPHREFPSLASTYRARRDHVIVRMLYGTNLGIADVRLLCWRQIDEHSHEVRVQLRSGAVRSFVLDAPLLAALNALRGCTAPASFDPGESTYCFPTAS